MLQQTQVTTVIDYFNRWMRRFPDVESLVRATEEEVLGMWQGLGYYSRARNLWRAAQAIVGEHRGVFPQSVDGLRALPGIGEYTAAAVAAFAFDQPVPVVDANIARVLVRLQDFRNRIDNSDGKKFLHAAASALQPIGRDGRRFNSALMELGALVCKPRNPDCLICPVQTFCRTPVAQSLPVKAARAVIEVVTDYRYLIYEGNRIFLQKSQGPRWKGMWMLPASEQRPLGRPIHELVYPITRYQVRLQIFESVLEPTAGFTSFDRGELAAIPIPSPHRRALGALLARLDSPVHSQE